MTSSVGRARLRVFERLAVGHVLAYPIAILWAMASIPLSIHLFIHDIDLLPDQAAIGRLVVRKVAWPAACSFVLVHAGSLLWAFAGDAAPGFKRFVWATAGVAAIGVVVGVGSWGWLLLR